jgi:hypothetical protein
MNRQTPLTVTPVMSDPTTQWCKTCKAYTLLVSHLLLLTWAGVTRRETYAWCEVHDNPEFEEADRG